LTKREKKKPGGRRRKADKEGGSKGGCGDGKGKKEEFYSGGNRWTSNTIH